jgi:hypothetical protein
MTKNGMKVIYKVIDTRTGKEKTYYSLRGANKAALKDKNLYVQPMTVHPNGGHSGAPLSLAKAK